MRIFVVDDDPSARMIARFQIEPLAVEVREFADGASCLAALNAAPDIVILDVEMPGIDGISVCRAIRAELGAEAGSAAQIIFTSAHDDLETRLKAYDAGGNDYIVKPYDEEELARKVGVASRAVQSARAANGQAQFAQQAAFTAMSSMAEMGVTQDFFRASFNCRTAQELSQAICAALGRYGLEGLIELRDEEQQHDYSKHGACSELETSLLRHASGLERIFQFRDRLAINYPHLSLLISKLPLDDPEHMGRLRDHLAVLAEGAEARFVAMGHESRRLVQAEKIMAASEDLRATLAEIARHQEAHRAEVLCIANDQMELLTHAFVDLGLTARQEESLVALSQRGIDRIAQLQDYSIALSQRLQSVSDRLKG